MTVVDLNPHAEKCPLCSSLDLYRYHANAFDSEISETISIIECESCKLAYQFPLSRTASESVDYFEGEYQKKEGQYFDPVAKREISQMQIEFISTLNVKVRNILDIGCGSGIFCKVAAENSWVVTGIDPGMEKESVNNDINLRLIKSDLNTIETTQKYSVVTMWDVIEHVENPLQVIRDAAMHLPEDGWLVLETGNYCSADRVKNGINCWIFQLDHRWYFSPETLTVLLKKAGFKEVKVANKVFRKQWSGNVAYSGPSIKEHVKGVLIKPHKLFYYIARYFRLAKIKKLEYAGMPIFTVAAKKGV